MTTIKILPEILSNQIAAGEVVERPVSIVKELVENSIDARAENIRIEIVNGGKSLIRVSDDGFGLTRDDALLAIERYATSKIYAKEDLFNISTMGFRGEALPSIASVSRFSLVTRTKQDDIGTQIDMAGGRILNVADAGAPAGTMVEVKALFYNIPARKKFLKTDTTETGHVTDAVYGLALAHPEIRFQLFVNNKLQKHFALTDDLFQRAVQVLGRDSARYLYPVEYEDAMASISGFCAAPLLNRSTSSKIFLFVNRRLIHDRGLVSAIFKGYKGRLTKGRFPLGTFFIDVAYDQVDVNVHPSKREIKFFNGQQVYQAMATAVEQALVKAQKDLAGYAGGHTVSDQISEQAVDEKTSDVKKKEGKKQYSPIQGRFQWSETQTGANEASIRGKDRWSDKSGQAGENLHGAIYGSQTDQALSQAGKKGRRRQDRSTDTDQFSILADASGEIKKERAVKSTDRQGPDTVSSENVSVIGQIMGTYILVEASDGLIMIDQHAAHERIVYERLKKRLNRLDVQTQTLAVAQTLEFTIKEADVFTAMLADLGQMGFLIEPFGGSTFVVKGVPAMIDDQDIQKILLDMVDLAAQKKNWAGNDQWQDECLMVVACHSAIRAKKQLSLQEMNALINDLQSCENPRHCPHGRPVQLFWSQHQIEKLFKRRI
jgi:DNA mismatch repair protein MutL